MSNMTDSGWSIDFAIPASRWSALGAYEHEETRASRRAWLRRNLGARRFKEEMRRGAIRHVERFAILIGVSVPGGTPLVPMYACEVAKPLIDAGTDAKLWPDDDSTHRVNTTYFAMRDQWCDGQYHMTFIVLPTNAPTSIDMCLRLHARPVHTLMFNIPHKLWLTSNFNDSDLLARQQSVNVYGSNQRFLGNVSPSNRKALRGNLMAYVMKQWATNYPEARMSADYSTVAGVSYPSGNDSDPDNATESIACILGSGLTLGLLPSITGTCGELSVYKLRERSLPSYHGVKVELYKREHNLASTISEIIKHSG